MPSQTLISRDGSKTITVQSQPRITQTTADTLAHLMGQWYFEENRAQVTENEHLRIYNDYIDGDRLQLEAEITLLRRNLVESTSIAQSETLRANHNETMYHMAIRLVNDIFQRFPEADRHYTAGLDQQEWQEVIDLTADTEDEEEYEI